MGGRATTILGTLLAGAAIAACGESQGEAGATGCRPVPERVVGAIERQLSLPDGELRGARAAPSADFDGVWYVSADVQGRGAEATDDIATWATTGLGDPGRIRAADPLAERFSRRRAVGGGAEHALGGDEGYERAQRCARAAVQAG